MRVRRARTRRSVRTSGRFRGLPGMTVEGTPDETVVGVPGMAVEGTADETMVGATPSSWPAATGHLSDVPEEDVGAGAAGTAPSSWPTTTGHLSDGPDEDAIEGTVEEGERAADEMVVGAAGAGAGAGAER